jgi:Protein of unknown function (DUF1592)/Protein of unknown function (DUF1588)/Protein of unknown function (DUF1595)
MSSGGSGVGAGAAGSAGAAGGEVAVGGVAGADAQCETVDAPAKQLVRLSLHQVLRSMGDLLGAPLEQELRAAIAGDLDPRSFPPLASAQEGPAYVEANLDVLDDLAERAGRYVSGEFATVTGCAPATDDCARTFLRELALQAFRRPLTDAEAERIEGRYEAARALDAGVTVEIAVQYGVYAIFHSPQFLYRTELGEEPESAGQLGSHEVASLLSYFLTDAPPDAELRAAAESDALRSTSALAEHARRLLETPAARENLSSVLWSHLRLSGLNMVVIDEPAFTPELRASMEGEARRFVERTWWRGRLDDLLTARTSFVDQALADIYGIAEFPPPGATLDGEGFAEVMLPKERVGLLTQPAFLAARARPTDTSVVQRGLAVRTVFVSGDVKPPPPTLSPEDLAAGLEGDLDATARRRAEARVEAEGCGECHSDFDAYGVALETFDPIGRYRTTDPEGRPIDTSFVLPVDVGGGTAADITEVAARLSSTGALPRRLAQALSVYALAPAGVGLTEGTPFARSSCLVTRVTEQLDPQSASLSELIAALVTDPAFVERRAPR